MSRPLSLFSVQAILILSIDDGSRILTKYYSNPHPPQGNQGDYPGQIAYKTVKDQKAFEKGLLGMLILMLGPAQSKHMLTRHREDGQADDRHHPV
jgi:hypothetical protein